MRTNKKTQLHRLLVAIGGLFASLVIAVSLVQMTASAQAVGVTPRATGLAPTSGSVVGGDIVTLSGEGFSSETAVYIDNARVQADSVRFVSESQLTFIAPTQLSPGSYSISVGDDSYSGIRSQLVYVYEAAAPTLTFVSPNIGPLRGGQQVTISGAQFRNQLQEARSVVTGYSHACGIFGDNKVFCWGNNNAGQLGDGTTVNKNVPVAIDASAALAGKVIVSLVAGSYHTCAITSDSALYCWGQNTYGQLGIGNNVSQSRPVAVTANGALNGKRVVSVFAGNYHTCATTDDGRAYCWGLNSTGQLGDTTTTNRTSPVAVNTTSVLRDKVVTKLGLGNAHSCATTEAGEAYCWGQGAYGQLGNDTTTQSNVPVSVTKAGVLSGKRVDDIVAGNGNSCAIAEGLPYCWGQNNNRQLGDGSTTNRRIPVAVNADGVLAGKRLVSISANASHVCATDNNGDAYCWGAANNGRLGNGSTAATSVPVAVDKTGVLQNESLSNVAAGGVFTCGLTTSASVACWGYAMQGQLGNDDTTEQLAPVRTLTNRTPEAVPTVRFGSMTALQNKTQFISPIELTVETPRSTQSGPVDIRVENGDAQYARTTDGYRYMDAHTPTSATPSTDTISGGATVTVRGDHFTEQSRILLQDEFVDTTFVDAQTVTFVVPPRPIPGMISLQVEDQFGQRNALSGGFTYSLPSPQIDSITPASGSLDGSYVTVRGSNFANALHLASSVTTGTNHSCGLFGDNRVYCWGYNTYGQLGDGTRVNSDTPVSVDTSGALEGKTITQISSGTNHTVALASDGTVYAWGYNNYGQLGDGTTTNRTSPVAVNTSGVLAGKTITQISSGYSHTVALASDGTVYAWGYNNYGQLGDGTATDRITPVAVDASGVLAGKTITQIAAGAYHVLIQTSDGGLYAWGYNYYGELGDGTTMVRRSPVSVESTGVLEGKEVTHISAGAYLSAVVASDGTVYTWGYNNYGQLGDGTTTSRTSPVAVNVSGVLAGKMITRVVAGTHYMVATDSRGSVYAWGYNNTGQLGNGTTGTGSNRFPVAVDSSGVLGGVSIAALAAGNGQTLVASVDGRVYGWGQNNYGQLGNGTTTATQLAPVELDSSKTEGTKPAVYFGASEVYHRAVTYASPSELQFRAPKSPAAGSVDVRIRNFDGNETTRTNGFEYVAPLVSPTVSPTNGLTTGGDTLTLTGQGFTPDTKVFVRDEQIQAVTFVNSTTIQFNSPAVMLPGDARITVEDEHGQRSQVDNTFIYTLPSPQIDSITPASGSLDGSHVTVRGSNFANALHLASSVTTGSGHSCGVFGDNRAYCWGHNNYGQLGNGTTTGSSINSSPVPVDTSGALAGKTITQISAGTNHTVALASDGTVYAWGYNNYGQLGDGTTSNRSTPIAVSMIGAVAGKTITKVSAGYNHTVALASDGTVYEWGDNRYGQLGDATTTGRTTPVAVDTSGVLAGKTVTQIAAGSYHVAVRTSDGELYAWGYNNFGEVGDGTSTMRRSPVAVDTSGALSGKSVIELAAGAYATAALTSDGSVYTWGYNGLGQLGDGTTTNRTTPVAVDASGALVGKTITQIAAGTYYMTALASDGSIYTWGYNNTGQLGNGTTGTDSNRFPVAVDTSGVLAGVSVAALAAGNGQTLVASTDGKVYGWGQNNYGQLGNGNLVASNELTAVALDGSMTEGVKPAVHFGAREVFHRGITYVSPNELQFRAPESTTAGRVDVRIRNFDGSDTTRTNGFEYIAPLTAPTVSPTTGLTTGGDTLTLTGQGFTQNTKVFVRDEQVLDVVFINDTTLQFSSPSVMVPGDARITIEDEHGQRSGTENGFVYVLPAVSITAVNPDIGPSEGGQRVQLTLDGNTPNALALASSVSTGVSHSCGVFGSGSVYCWGRNLYGQLGNGTRTDSATPVAVDTSGVLAGKSIVQVAAGDHFTVALASDGTVYTWGYNMYGQLGNGAALGSSGSNTHPVAVDTSGVLAGKTVTQIVAGVYHVVALTSDGSIYSWGYNNSGQLGDATTTNRSSPTAVDTSGVLAGKVVTKITAGRYHTVAATSDGGMYSWGSNAYGELGDNTKTNRNVPIAIPETAELFANTDVKQIVGGAYSTHILTSDGKLYAWGFNRYGQLGDGTTTDRMAPVAVDTTGVLSGKTITQITAGTYYTLATASDGKVYSWGYNSTGQLGDGTTTNHSIPVAVDTSGVLAGVSVATLAAGSGQTLATSTDGKVYGWGQNNSGQLGNGSTDATQVTPVGLNTNASAGTSVSVYFDQTQSSKVEAIEGNTVTVVTPARAAGVADVTMRDYQGGETTLENSYTFVAPTSVNSVTPSQSLISGGDVVTIIGSGFTEEARVHLDGQLVESVEYVNDTTLRFTSPSTEQPGMKELIVEDQYGQRTTVSGGFTYYLPAPNFTSITPAVQRSGITGVRATIKGSGFVYKDATSSWYTVSFGDSNASATSTKVLDDETLEVTIPSRNPGRVNVTIGGTYVMPVVAENAFTYTASSYQFTNSYLNIDTNQTGMLTIRANGVSDIDTKIALSSSSNTSQFAVDMDESEETRWSHNTVVLPAGQQEVNVWFRDSISGSPIVTADVEGVYQFQQTQRVSSPYRLVVSGISNPIKSGVPSSVTVRVVDRQGYQNTTYDGTIRFASSDSLAQLPAEYTFKPSDYGIKTFTNGVAFRTAGARCVTVTDSIDKGITGSQCVRVDAAAQGTISRLAFISPEQRVAAGKYSSIISVQTQDSSGTAIPVAADTELYLYSSSASAQFSTDGQTWSSERPYQITIPAGSTIANFYYKSDTAETARITAKDEATESSTDNGWRDTRQDITTGVSPATKLVVTGTAALKPGVRGQYTVSLVDNNGNKVSADSDIPIRVGSTSNSGLFYVPHDADSGVAGPVEFSIPSGYSEATIGYSDAQVTADEPLRLTFVDARPQTEVIRLADGTFDVHVRDTFAASIELSGNAQANVGEWTALTVQLRGENQEASVNDVDTRVTLTSTSEGGVFSASPNGSPLTDITIPAGSTQQRVYYRDTSAADVTITANTEQLGAASHDMTLVSLKPVRLGFSAPRISAELNTATPLSISAYDVYGNITAVEADQTVYLQSDSSTSAFSTNASTWDAQTVTIPEGVATTLLYIRDSEFKDDDYQVSARTTTSPDETASIAAAETNVYVASQSPTEMQFTTETRTILAGETSQQIGFSLLKSDGSPALQNGDDTVAVSVQTGDILSSVGGEAVQRIAIDRGTNTGTLYYTATQTGMYDLSVEATNGTRATQKVTVLPNVPFRIQAQAQPQTLNTNQIAMATIQLKDVHGNDTTASEDTLLTLEPSCAYGGVSQYRDEWRAINSLTIPADEGSAIVYFKSSRAGQCSVAVAGEQLQSANLSFTIRNDTAASIRFTTEPQTVTAGVVSARITAQLLQADDSPAYQNGTNRVALSVNGGQISSSATEFTRASINPTVPSGESEVTFYYRGTEAGLYTMHAGFDTLATEQQISVRPDAAQKLVFSTEEQHVAAGAPSEIIGLTITDQFNNETSRNAATTLQFESSCGAMSFSLDSVEWSAVSTLTIPAGTTGAQFYAQSYAFETCTITVRADDLEAAHQQMTIYDDAYPYRLEVSAPPETLTKGDVRPITVNLIDQYGDIVAAKTRTTVQLHSERGGSFGVGSTLVFEPGVSTMTKQYTANVSGTWNITATHSGQNALGSDAVSVSYREGEAVGLAITHTGAAIAGERAALTISVVNEFGVAVVAGGSTEIALSSTNTGAQFFENENEEGAVSTITIPENEQSVTVYYRQTESGDATIRATSNELGDTTHLIGVRSNTIASMQFISQPFSGERALTYGQTGTARIQFYDVYGNIAQTDASMRLNARTLYGATGQRTQTITVEPGETGAVYRVQSVPVGAFRIEVSDAQAQLATIEQSGEVVPGRVADFSFSESTFELERGATKRLNVVLLNEHGQPTTATEDTYVRLAMNQGTGRFSNSSQFTVAIQGVTVRAGQSSAGFYYHNNTGDVVNERGESVVHEIAGTVSLNGESLTQTAQAHLVYGSATQLGITTPRRSTQANHPTQVITVERQNTYGRPVPVEQDTELHVRSSSPTGSFGGSKVDWGVRTITIRKDRSAADLYYMDTVVGDALVTVADSLPLNPDTGLKNATQTVTTTREIVARTVDNFLVTNISTPQEAGTPSSVIVIARDAEGFIVPTYEGVVRFTSSDDSAQLPYAFRFERRHGGVMTFTNLVAFADIGTKSVTVSDANGITGTQENIVVLDGNVEPVAGIVISQPETLTVAPNVASQNVSFELRDADGRYTLAGMDGLKVRLTSSSPTAQFATSASGPWTNTLEYTVEPGYGFGNFYYKDATLGASSITITDWQDGFDGDAIANDSLDVTVNSIRVDGDAHIQSRNVFGEYETASHLFSSRADGRIDGQVDASFRAQRLADGEAAQSNWQTQWRKGVTLLNSGAQTSRTGVQMQIRNIVAQAGDTAFYATAQATETSFDDPYSVVSRELPVPVSGWTSTVTATKQNEGLSAQIQFRNLGTIASPDTFAYYLVDAKATSVDSAVARGGGLNPDAQQTITVQPDEAFTSDYRLVVETFDAEGEKTSQAMSQVVRFSEDELDTPEGNEQDNTDEHTGDVPPTQNGGDVAIGPNSSEADTADQSDTADEVAEESAAPSDDTEASETSVAIVSMTWLNWLYVVSAGALVLLTLREAYREYAKARYIRSAIAGRVRLRPLKIDSVQALSPLEQPARRSIVFWLSIALAIALTVFFSVAYHTAANELDVSAAPFVIFVIASSAAVCALMLSHSRAIERQKSQMKALL